MDISSLRERADTAFTVTELNKYIKNLFEGSRLLSSVTVRAEISNFVNHRSGHMYFSLKDSEAQIRAVMFRQSAQSLKFIPENGMKVTVHGSVTVYPRDGAYQIYVNYMQPDGIGALYVAYEQLKKRLEAEGLFDGDHKKPIPKIPKAIGVITSSEGAAVRDIINVTGRRYPSADVYVYPALVQGEMAEASLIRGVDYFDKSGLVDVVIIGRGGGSIEDLWAFNGEKLARRIFEANVPIISAVGHETDFTICDFVSDLRAPTPSAAAELAVPDRLELARYVDYCAERADSAIRKKAERSRERLNSATEKITDFGAELISAEKKDRLSRNIERALVALNGKIDGCVKSLATAAAKAEALSPLGVLSRGYAIVTSGGKCVTNAKKLKFGEEISVRFSKGKITAEVKNIEDKI